MCKTETKTPPKPSTTPSGSQPTGGAQTSCHPACTLTSQTKATSPADRTRTKIGVGEEVVITVKGNPATWAITSGTGKLTPNTGARKSVTFKADDKDGNVTVTATGSGCACVNTITFKIVKPASWTMKRQANTKLRHTANRPDCGWKGIMYVHPNDVNFYNVETREKDSQYVGTGSYSGFNGDFHGNYPAPDFASDWFPLNAHTDADGSTDNIPDTIYTGLPSTAITGTAPPFKKGDGHFPITIQWQIIGSTDAKDIHAFPVVRQEDEIFENGRCESRKGSHTEGTMYTDPASNY